MASAGPCEIICTSIHINNYASTSSLNFTSLMLFLMPIQHCQNSEGDHPVISCFIKIQIGVTFLVPAYPGCPGKEAVKPVSLYKFKTKPPVHGRPSSLLIFCLCWFCGYVVFVCFVYLFKYFMYVFCCCWNTALVDWVSNECFVELLFAV